MKTIVIELHGFNRNYIDATNTPFLFDLAQKYGLGKLEPPFGPDALTSLWTGCHPVRHDQFFKFAFHKKKLNYQKYLPTRLCNYLSNAYRALKGHDFLTKLAADKKSGYFSVHKKYHYFHPNGFNVKTLFDILRENKKSFLYYEHPQMATENKRNLFFRSASDKVKVDHFLSKLKKLKKEFNFLLLRDIDIYGHRYGPNSNEIKTLLSKQDSLIRKIFSHISEKEDNFILLSCYGMVPIKNSMNLEEKLPKFGKGYYYFLDSTFARFWFFDPVVKNDVMQILNNINEGHALNDEEKEKYKVNFKHNKFGEEIFLMNYGTVISPNFFNNKPEKGMHNYDLSNQDGNEFGIIISNKNIKKEGRVIDIFPSILEIMNIHQNKTADGCSLLSHPQTDRTHGA